MVEANGPFGWKETSQGLFQRVKDDKYPYVPCPYCGTVMDIGHITHHAKKDHGGVDVRVRLDTSES